MIISSNKQLYQGFVEGNPFVFQLVMCYVRCNYAIIAGSLESANSSILAARRHFKEVVGKKIRILL